MGANANPYLVRAEDVVKRLGQARAQLAIAAIKAGRAEKDEKKAKLFAEVKVVQSVGGDIKALGPNETAQGRSIAIGLAADADYQSVMTNALDAFDAARTAEAEMLALQDEFRFLLAAIPVWAAPDEEVKP